MPHHWVDVTCRGATASRHLRPASGFLVGQPGINRPASAFSPLSALAPPRYQCPASALTHLHPGNTHSTSAPQKIRQPLLADHSVPLCKLACRECKLAYHKCSCTPERHVHPVTRRLNVISPSATFLNS
jgi:hypothetical protein